MLRGHGHPPPLATAGLSVCEPPISISTRSSPSSKPTSPLRFRPAPASWQGKARAGVYRSRRLTQSMRRRMIMLRLSQLASQHAQDAVGLNLTRAFTPRKDVLAAISELGQQASGRSKSEAERGDLAETRRIAAALF